MRQLGLFGGEEDATTDSIRGLRIEPLIRDEDHELARQIPRFVRFGTSSWSFPGWSGIVWRDTPTENELAKAGLAAYAQQPLLRAVSLDRTYYAPLRADDVKGYSAQLAFAASSPRASSLPLFKMTTKVWDEITTAIFPRHPRYGVRAGTRNVSFLDHARFEAEVLLPYIDAGAPAWLGPFVFELTPMPRGALDERTLVTRVDDFLSRLPATMPSGQPWQWAFELRNQELFGSRWLDMLRANRAAHVFTFWTAMPPLQMQLRAKAITAPFTVVRLMLPPYTRYASRKADFAPFNVIAEPQEEMRDDVVDILRAAASAGCSEGYVLVNNKAEGSAPLTVRAIAKKAASAFAGA